MNILVTGIHGFVGSNLVVALKERHSLYGLDIVAPEKEGVVKTFSGRISNRLLFRCGIFLNSMPLFIWLVKPMIRKTGPQPNPILILIRD